MTTYNKTIAVPAKKYQKKEKNLCVVLIAHDSKKEDLIYFVKENENFKNLLIN